VITNNNNNDNNNRSSAELDNLFEYKSLSLCGLKWHVVWRIYVRQIGGLDLSLKRQMKSPEVSMTAVSIEIRPTVCCFRCFTSHFVSESSESRAVWNIARDTGCPYWEFCGLLETPYGIIPVIRWPPPSFHIFTINYSRCPTIQRHVGYVQPPTAAFCSGTRFF
jgi:hypothetical protein